eukprot:TRINITY_DN6396_c0_g2_i1.p1 TRINITY_DN6396_c0_g2~~TRINITY_DN6396_c0_g2_i1.p1  ORF type:complete len:237 (-),score=39.89 TRINITY_DN6396_c0_g2_i1:150-860(-)
MSADPKKHARSCLIFGSSVSEGCGSSTPDLGWSAHLAEALKTRGYDTQNFGTSGTCVAFWQKALCVPKQTCQYTWMQILVLVVCRVCFKAAELRSKLLPQVKTADLVILSLSCANEGLNWASADEARQIEQKFTTGLKAIALHLRSIMKPGARLVLGGPYPHGDYTEENLEIVLRVLVAMRTWDCVDYVIDFLQDEVHSGRGRWHGDSAADPYHPNDKGHLQMFNCVDLKALVGER